MSRRGWVATVATAVTLVVLLWATGPGTRALLGPPSGGLGLDDFTTPAPVESDPSVTPTMTLREPPPAQAQDPAGAGAFDVVGTLLGVLLGLVVLVAVVLLVVRLVRGGTPRAAADPGAELPELLLDEEEAAAQVGALAEGSPRNAIIACWLRLEDTVTAVGTPPLPSETSAELTARVLSSWSVDAGSIDDLARLYREARFSRHELGEDKRQQAVAAVERVHADLRRAAREARLRRAGDGAGGEGTGADGAAARTSGAAR